MRIARILLYITIVLLAAVALMPLVWLVAAAFKSSDDFYKYNFFPPLHRLYERDPVTQWPLGVQNFVSLFTQLPYLRFLVNSLFVTCVIVLVQLFFASLGGFALAKYEFRAKRPIMLLMLATMMLPAQVMLAPLYELVYRLGVMDSHLGLILPGMVSVFGMFLFRQSMMQIPDDLLQAARIDGCSEFGLYWNIALPVTRPMVGAFCLMSFMGTWNSFLWPQIILQSKDLFTLPIGLSSMVGLYKEDYGALMAGTLLSILPVAALFFLLQREFIAGLTSGAVKG